VICDRFSDSTRVYQSVAGGVDPAAVEALERLVVAPTLPDLTFILDLAPEAGLARAAGRRQAGTPTDAYETRGLAFHERLRTGYLAIAGSEPRRCVLLDGAAPVGRIAELVWAEVERRLLQGAR
jgi:dTMP kinase